MLQVGQELWYVPKDRRYVDQAYSVRVTKIGRKWADLDPAHAGRVNVETLWIDGGRFSSPGRCYLSKEEYEKAMALSNAWRDFKDKLPWHPPEGVTMDKLEQVKSLLAQD